MRRRGLGVLAAACLLSGQAVASSIGGNTAEAAASTTTPIQHVVVIYSENRSFDHYFGAYPNALNPPGEPRFVAKPGTPQVNGLTPDLLQHNPNLVNPFRIDPKTNGVFTCSHNHTYTPEQRAVDGGLMDRFVQETGAKGASCTPNGGVLGGQTMGYFDGNTVTGLWNYAQNFALSDNFFGTTYGPSTPGALNLVSGRTQGATPASAGAGTKNGTVVGDPDPALDDCSKNTNKATLNGRNVGDLLNTQGVTWGWFEGGFKRVDGVLVCDGKSLNLNNKADDDYEPHHEPFQYWASTANPHHLPPTSNDMIGKTDQANHQYDLGDFWKALDSHAMPSVSYLKAAGYQDGHPGLSNSDPLDEQTFLVNTINRIQKSDEWASTAIVIAYDDSDGLYDHVFPPNVHHSADNTTPGPIDALYPGDTCKGSYTGTTFFTDRCGYGPRVPMLVISPYAKRNFVDHTLTDQTSILRFIEDNWSLGRIGDDSFDVDAGSIANMFDFDRPDTTRLQLDPVTGEPGPPEIQSVVLTPASPRTNDMLTAGVAASEPNELPLTFRYVWEKDDGSGWQVLAETHDSLDLSVPGNGDKGDRLRVTVTANNGYEDGTAKTASPVSIANTPPQIGVDPGARSVDYSDPMDQVAVTASDADGDAIVLSASGLPDGVSLMDTGAGSGTVAGTVTSPGGTYAAQVAASDGSDSASAPLDITVNQEQASATYTGRLLIPTGSTSATTAPVPLKASIIQQDDGNAGDLSKASVIFDLFSTSNLTSIPDKSFAVPVSSDGTASVQPAITTGDWTVRVRFDPGNGYFTGPNSDPVVVTVYQPSLQSFVTGGGWVHDFTDENDHANFGFSARYKKTGEPTGHLTYVLRGSDGYDYLVKSNSWQDGGLAIGTDKASFAGKASVTVVDASTGLLVDGLGGGNYSYRVDVSDGAEDGFSITVYSPSGALYHRAGTPSELLPLGGGNVVIHSG